MHIINLHLHMHIVNPHPHMHIVNLHLAEGPGPLSPGPRLPGRGGGWGATPRDGVGMPGVEWGATPGCACAEIDDGHVQVQVDDVHMQVQVGR